ILKSVTIELVEHMDHVLRKALVLEDPEAYLRKPAEPAATAEEIAPAPTPFPPSVQPDTDIVTHCQPTSRLLTRPRPGEGKGYDQGRLDRTRGRHARPAEGPGGACWPPRLRGHREGAAQRRQGEHLGFRDVRGLGAKSAHGPEPEDRREHRDPRVEIGEVQGRQGVEGRAQVAPPRPPRSRSALVLAADNR